MIIDTETPQSRVAELGGIMILYVGGGKQDGDLFRLMRSELDMYMGKLDATGN